MVYTSHKFETCISLIHLIGHITDPSFPYTKIFCPFNKQFSIDSFLDWEHHHSVSNIRLCMHCSLLQTVALNLLIKISFSQFNIKVSLLYLLCVTLWDMSFLFSTDSYNAPFTFSKHIIC